MEILDHFESDEGDYKPWGMGERKFCMLMHLSILTSWLLFFLGFIIPIVMWALHRKHSHFIDKQGKCILNFFITQFLVGIIFGLVLFTNIVVVSFDAGWGEIVLVIISMLLYVLFFIVRIVLNAIAASNGKIGKYPLAIPLFR